MHKSATLRTFCAPILGFVMGFGLIDAAPARATEGSKASSSSSSSSIYGLKLKDIHGKEVKLADYRGKVLLIVNTASGCGFTPQMANLVNLKKKYGAQGFEVLAFPSNDFNQEKGSAAEIEKYATDNFSINFPLMAEGKVTGTNPLFQLLTDKTGGIPKDVAWNFEKFLINRQGEPVARFRSRTSPEASEVTNKLEALLASRASTVSK